MPNHCDHDFWISGPTDVVNHILATHLDAHGAINADSVIPYPVIFKTMDEARHKWTETYFKDDYGIAPKDGVDAQTIPPCPKDGFNSGGYEWCVEQWGTKWGCYDGRGITDVPLKSPKTRKVQLGFLTAWSPALPVYNALAKMYPNCNFKVAFYEQGAAYSGWITWHKGARINEKHNNMYRGNRGG